MEIKNKNGLTEKEFLEQYTPGNYDRPSVTVDMILFTIDEVNIDIRKNPEKELKILLIKRGDHPYINHWAIPGGFVGIDEDIEDAAYRELEEETNLKEDIYLEQLYTFGKPNRDPRMRIISVAYMALTKKENIKKTLSGDDASDALWFKVKKEVIDNENFFLNLTNDERDIFISYKFHKEDNKWQYDCRSNEKLAFDHVNIINTAIDRMRNKVFYTDIAFKLLPEKFTLSELRKVYEIILGKDLEQSNFRKRILDLVEPINFEGPKVGHRPGKYFRLKK